MNTNALIDRLALLITASLITVFIGIAALDIVILFAIHGACQ